jgi:hypothetical protein
VSAITSEQHVDVGVVDETLLNDFVEAAVRWDEPRLALAREALESKIGVDAVVDAAAVIGCFQRLNRMADGAGIELDEQMLLMTAGIREELNIEGYFSAANTPKLRGLKRILSVLLRPLEGFMMRAMQKGIQKAQSRQREEAK